jgi:hypothetical protein
MTHLSVFLFGIFVAVFGFKQVDKSGDRTKPGVIQWTRPGFQFGPHALPEGKHGLAVFPGSEKGGECRLHREAVRFAWKDGMILFSAGHKIVLENDFRKILTTNKVRVVEAKEFQQMVRCGQRARVSFN